MVLVFVLFGLLSTASSVFEPPIMGWSTWCTDNTVIPCYDDYCDESEILSVAKSMSENLLSLGYEWINLDDCWSERRLSNGSIMWNATRFPSGMPSFIHKIHELGLKISLYTDVGEHTCRYGRPGSWPYYEEDARRFAEWGVDGVKMDWCGHPGGHTAQQLYTNFSNALKSTGKNFQFMICEWGLFEPWTWAPEISNSWRTGPDHMPLWWTPATPQDPGVGQGTYNMIMHQKGLSKYAHSGAWNDPDFLMLGYFWQTRAQQRTEFSFWCLFASPLIVATDVRKLHDKPEMLNKAAIAVNQDPLGIAGDFRHQDKRGGQVWSKPLSGGVFAVILFNSNGVYDIIGEIIHVDLEFTDEMMPGWPKGATKAKIFDIWEEKSLGVFDGKFTGKYIEVRASRFLIVEPIID